MMRSLLPDRSQSLHRHLAHPSKHVFHSHPNPASSFVCLLVLFAGPLCEVIALLLRPYRLPYRRVPAARDRVFKAALDANANLVSLAGDTHNAWAFDLDHAGEKVGVEFGVQGVTSPGLESYASYLPVDVLERETVAHNRQLKWMDGSRRGYMAVELTPQAATSEFRFLSSVREKGAGVSATHRVSARAGSRMLDVG